MVKQTAKIEKYDGGNVYFVGKDKPLFIEPKDIKAAMANFPPGKVVTFKTKDKQKGTLDGMADPTEREMQSYLQDQKAAGNPDQAFQPAGDLPRDPEAEKQRAAAALQQNLDEKAGKGDRPTCFKAALCPKNCDGTKDPCQFKPKKSAPAEPPKQPTGSPAPINPPTGTGTVPQTTPAPEQGHNLESVVRSSIQDLMPSDRVGYRISLAGMVNSVIEMEKMSTDAPKTYVELEADVKKKALALFVWCDGVTTQNITGVK